VIYDCFTFFNELDLLEIRLNILYEKVDFFVIVEANKTHTGKDKPFYVQESFARFERFKEKIKYIQVTDMPSGNAWTLENFQRNCIMRGLDKLADDDIVAISDLDEIINPDVFNRPITGTNKTDQEWCCFYANRSKGGWNGSVIGTGAMLKNSNPQAWRNGRASHNGRIPNAGWHLSWMGGPDAIITKLEAFAETHENNPHNKNKERIIRCLDTDDDMFKQAQVREYRGYHPIFNEPKYAHLLKKDTKRYLKIMGNHCGFFSSFLITLDNLIYCYKNNIIPIVNWNNANYKTPGSDNVFTDYFEPIDAEIDGTVETSDRELSGGFSIDYIEKNPEYKNDFNKIIKKYIKVKKTIQEKFNTFVSGNSIENVTGIHIRGLEGRVSKDGNPIPLHDLNFYYELLKKVQTKIFVATDNDEIIDFLKNKLGSDKIIAQYIIRCSKFDNKGLMYYTVDNYAKGEGVLLDALILSKCKEIFIVQSNVSIAPILWNKDLKYTRYDIPEPKINPAPVQRRPQL
jgi:beta-1,4-mannosyl-glycoprotein beta-1,4-N-acetylglucosaminyltransferase